MIRGSERKSLPLSHFCGQEYGLLCEITEPPINRPINAENCVNRAYPTIFGTSKAPARPEIKTLYLCYPSPAEYPQLLTRAAFLFNLGDMES